MLPLQGKLVSRHKNEYAGPCPFKGIGRDRFHWWAGSNNWWCRKECPDCPGEPCPTGGRRGWFKDGEARSFRVIPPPERPKMSQVWEYRHNLDGQTLDYLADRGIRRDTASRFLVGRNRRRLTIPNVVKNGHAVCYGIKKRWIGTPPEPWIDKYTMEPGSRGLSIFNYNRLISRTHWPYFLIVEGVLDCMLLDQIGIPAAAPFGGGGVWDPRWNRSFDRVDQVIHVADWDEPDEAGARQGTKYALKRIKSMKRGLLVFPPGGYEDLGEAYLAGENISAWVRQRAN